MKTNKIYLIREINCDYSDEYIYKVSVGKIVHKLMTMKEAQIKINELEREMYRDQLVYIGDYISNSDSKYWNKVNDFTNFLKKKFDIILGDDLLIHEKPHRTLTIEEIDTVREIIGFKFYSLEEFKEDSSFYIPILNPKVFINTEDNMKFFKDYKIVTFYKSYKEAVDEMCKAYFNHFVEEPKIYGLIEELSETPDLLKTIIDYEEDIKYEDGKITFEKNRANILSTINDLLTEKPIFVKLKTLEEIENKKY